MKPKFRAWIRDEDWDEEWGEQQYMMCYDLAFEEHVPINDLLAGIENLMQSTGLFDQNKKEIYEGDIIRYDGEKNVGEVRFGTLAIQWEGDGKYYPLLWFVKFSDNRWGRSTFPLENGGTVIGNVWENPELLKGA